MAGCFYGTRSETWRHGQPHPAIGGAGFQAKALHFREHPVRQNQSKDPALRPAGAGLFCLYMIKKLTGTRHDFGQITEFAPKE